MKVWAIFSIENEYNQPKNNLVKLYKNKPTMQQLDSWWQGYVSEEYSKFGLLHHMLTGSEIRFTPYGASYRLQEIDMECN